MFSYDVIAPVFAAATMLFVPIAAIASIIRHDKRYETAAQKEKRFYEKACAHNPRFYAMIEKEDAYLASHPKVAYYERQFDLIADQLG